MTWLAIAALAGGAYLLKVLGLAALGPRAVAGRPLVVVALLPAALLPALIVVQTFTLGRSLRLDARAVGLAVACLAVWRRAPFAVVMVAAAASTAATRALAA